jgi:hypothetical protein
MSEKKRRTCTICGAGFVPTGNNQKYCPDCRKQLQENGTVKEAYLRYQKARQPGSVIKSQIETPEDNILQDAETRQEVGNNESGGSYENVKYCGPFVTMYEKEEKMNGGNGGGGGGTHKEILTIPIEEQVKKFKRELPDWEGFVERASEILLAYGRNELIDKDEFLARIRERLEDF